MNLSKKFWLVISCYLSLVISFAFFILYYFNKSYQCVVMKHIQNNEYVYSLLQLCLTACIIILFDCWIEGIKAKHISFKILLWVFTGILSILVLEFLFKGVGSFSYSVQVPLSIIVVYFQIIFYPFLASYDKSQYQNDRKREGDRIYRRALQVKEADGVKV